MVTSRAIHSSSIHASWESNCRSRQSRGVKAGPREHVTARLGLSVLRLVHVPEDDEVDLIHRQSCSGDTAAVMLHSRFPPCAFLTAILSAKFSVMRSSDSSSSRLFYSCRSSFGSWSSWCAIPDRARRLQNFSCTFFPAYSFLPFRWPCLSESCLALGECQRTAKSSR